MAAPDPIPKDLHPSTLAGMCGLSEGDWSVIQELISNTPAMRRRALSIAKRAGPTADVWLKFLESRVRSAMVDFPVTETFNWSRESLEMSCFLHRYVIDLAAGESGNRRVSEQGPVMGADGLCSANSEPLGSTAPPDAGGPKAKSRKTTRTVLPKSSSSSRMAIAGSSTDPSRSKASGTLRALAGTLALALDDDSVPWVAPTLTFAVSLLDATKSICGSYTFIYTDSPPSLRVFLDRVRSAHAIAPERRIRTMDVGIGVGTKRRIIQVSERAGSWEWSAAVEAMANRGGRSDVFCVFDEE